MIFPDVVDLQLVGVFDRGIPNQERIVIKTNSWVNMAEYGVLIGLLGQNNMASPYYDNFFHFKEISVVPNTWIFLYTGPGNEIQSKMPSGDPAFIYHWGKPVTAFADSNVIPILVRIGAVQLGLPPQNQRQIGDGK